MKKMKNKVLGCHNEKVRSTDVVGKEVVIPRKSQIFVGISANKELMNKASLFSRVTCSLGLPQSLRSFAMTLPTLTLAALLSATLASESRAAISCVFSDGGKTVTITGGGSDDLWYSGCSSSNSTSTDNWTYSNDWKNNIKDITIGSGINRILGDNAFANATNLENLTISNGVTFIAGNAFKGATNLKNVTLPNTLTKISSATFKDATSLTNITIPSSVKVIEAQAFSGASTLESVMVPEGVTSIGSQAFSGASSLSNISLPSTLTSIERGAFSGTSSLTNITFPEGLLKIESGAFSGSGITSITIPGTVNDISDQFFKCDNLTEIAISDTITPENVAGWQAAAFEYVAGRVTSIRCVDSQGNDSTKADLCAKALEKFFYDENGKCKVNACFSKVQKIGDTCVGYYYGSASNDGTCVGKSSCTNGGNLINSDTRQCVTPANCTGMYVADTVNKKCFKMPGCVNYADGACQECDSDYLTNSSGTCTPAADCKNGLHADGGACVANPEGCNTFAGNKCTECNSGLIKQEGACVAGCGASFKLNDGECDRVRYTPAEAAAVLKDTDNELIMTFKVNR